MKKKFSVALFLAFLFVFPSLSMANEDPCYSLDNNPEWIALYTQFTEAFEKDQYVDSLSYAFQMQAICERSPLLNFILGSNYKKIGDNENALRHFRRATSYLNEFTTDSRLAQKFWQTRLEAEKEMLSVPECPEEDPRLRNTIREQKQIINDDIDLYGKIMWSGIGIGAGGLAIAATGLGIALATEPEFKLKDFAIDPASKNTPAVTSDNINVHRAGYVLLGLGLGLAASGTVMAVLSGVRRAKLKELPETDFSFSFTGTGASLLIRF